ncbi:hypothetical protein PPL_09395 [Heterostelium album PN500]|uniref:Uncharacterized protein n=1 Tax=Heterostelium pallidum (strain ATCC 26659 / Pp 5 / PN500) TaxID=670386 RepID=D3BLG1_HETP5|nr:hypothetical protein PPL_09395 [Heterostelium album PN500]EFA77895.1 hypothetical protein PPL_09395 [Heterostelium album PN500]|eukprot:XP_020430023.1 hypothetical protein PPL_09395 [Heterostelium album PN500]
MNHITLNSLELSTLNRVRVCNINLSMNKTDSILSDDNPFYVLIPHFLFNHIIILFIRILITNQIGSKYLSKVSLMFNFWLFPDIIYQRYTMFHSNTVHSYLSTTTKDF